MIDNHSLREFLDKYAAVEIPILQRDYAQGRLDPRTKGMNKKGENFIRVLFNALREEKGLHMDIIYGSIETRDSDRPEIKTFIPLDGQPRLTTLSGRGSVKRLPPCSSDLLMLHVVQHETSVSDFVP